MRKRGLLAKNNDAKAQGKTAVQKHWAHNLLKGIPQVDLATWVVPGHEPGDKPDDTPHSTRGDATDRDISNRARSRSTTLPHAASQRPKANAEQHPVEK